MQRLGKMSTQSTLCVKPSLLAASKYATEPYRSAGFGKADLSIRNLGKFGLLLALLQRHTLGLTGAVSFNKPALVARQTVLRRRRQIILGVALKLLNSFFACSNFLVHKSRAHVAHAFDV